MSASALSHSPAVPDAFVGTVMVVHIAFATLLAAAPRREGTLGKMRLTPIANAIRDTKTG
ncbi:MAG: hypothetical protein HY719_03680, partial [Planctomycetes bacterium]|nr:hypothetical protein [Planctomycetota bacterium]